MHRQVRVGAVGGGEPHDARARAKAAASSAVTPAPCPGAVPGRGMRPNCSHSAGSVPRRCGLPMRWSMPEPRHTSRESEVTATTGGLWSSPARADLAGGAVAVLRLGPATHADRDVGAIRLTPRRPDGVGAVGNDVGGDAQVLAQPARGELTHRVVVDDEHAGLPLTVERGGIVTASPSFGLQHTHS